MANPRKMIQAGRDQSSIRRVPATARAALDNRGFRDIADFARAVRLANPAAADAYRVDDRLALPSNVHAEVGDAAGAYLVPPAFRQQIVEIKLAKTAKAEQATDAQFARRHPSGRFSTIRKFGRATTRESA